MARRNWQSESFGHDRSPVSPAGRFTTADDVHFNLVRIKGKSSSEQNFTFSRQCEEMTVPVPTCRRHLLELDNCELWVIKQKKRRRKKKSEIYQVKKEQKRNKKGRQQAKVNGDEFGGLGSRLVIGQKVDAHRSRCPTPRRPAAVVNKPVGPSLKQKRLLAIKRGRWQSPGESIKRTFSMSLSSEEASSCQSGRLFTDGTVSGYRPMKGSLILLFSKS